MLLPTGTLLGSLKFLQFKLKLNTFTMFVDCAENL